MQVNIGQKIKALRHRDGRTQEMLANAIGVTAQAISRWEASGGYPDMEVIPSIANYFGVTIDALFGYECERAKKIETLVAEIEELNKDNNGVDICIDKCLQKAREGLIEFPGNEKLMLLLASLLYNAGYARYGEHHLVDTDGYDIYDTKRHSQYAEWQEAIAIYEKLLFSLGEGEQRQQVIRELLQLYVNIGTHEKARAVVQNAPSMDACREMLMLNTCDGAEKSAACEAAFIKTLSASAGLLVSTVMLNHRILSSAETVNRIENAIQLLTLANREKEFSAQLARLHLYLSEFLWRRSDYDHAFEALDKAADYASVYDRYHDLSGEARMVYQLPDIWPWWMVPDCTQTAKEMKADPLWAAWETKCRK